MFSAIEIYNNPTILFKAEIFVVLSIIAWTYLLHAFYREQGTDYRYYEKKNKRKYYSKTKHGAYKYWELERCLNEKGCPLETPVIENLKFLIGIRHEIEHQMTNNIDEWVSAKFHACALNFNEFIKERFGDKYGIDENIALCIQLSPVDPKKLNSNGNISSNVRNYIAEFERNLDADVYNSDKYGYRVHYVQISANHPGDADSVVTFVKDSAQREEISRVLIKDRERPKYLPAQVVAEMKKKGFPKFNITSHTLLWKNNGDSLKTSKYGCLVAGKSWYWYQTWVDYVYDYCEKHKDDFQ